MLRSLSISLFLATSSVHAQTDVAGLVEIGERTFLGGQLPWETAERPSFLPLNGIDWVHNIMDADPVLGPRATVFFIDDDRNTLSDLLSMGWNRKHYGSEEAVLDPFRIDGIKVEVDGDAPQPFISYLFMEDGPAPSWKVSFSYRRLQDERSELSYCSMLTIYPPDMNISVGLRMYAPPFAKDIDSVFPAMAQRAVEILTCLDATFDIPASQSEAAMRLAELQAAHPDLRGCGDGMSS